jgi:ABC-type branched-subunit amino acid transport system substrate-binding protein
MKRMRAVCLILFCFSLPIHALFGSLSRLSAYAEHAPEYPEIDNTDWSRPDFTSFYRSQMPSFWSRIKDFFDLKKKTFDLTEFEKTLQAVTAQRKEKGFVGEFVQKIPFKSQGRVIVFGDLQGAFHSLVRALRYLETQDAVSEQIKVEEGSYIVFNGNAIDAAAYNLETLMTILVLMQKNPERVIYIGGPNEQNKEKKFSGLYRQLKEVAGDKADGLFAHITDFFDTLPHAVYVMRGLSGALKIFSRSVPDFTDDLVGAFLSSHDNDVILHAKDYGKQGAPAVPISVMISAHDNTHTQGLKRYVGPPTTWTVFSSPTGAHRRLYGFFRDAFVIVDSAIHFHDWMITLYAADLQAGTGFSPVGTYNLMTGVFISGKQIDFFDLLEMQHFEDIVKEKKKLLAELKEDCKQSDKKNEVESKKQLKNLVKQVLLVGTSADLSKSAKNIGNKINETLSKAFEEKNKQGGVRGVTFQSIFLDDSYTPEIARTNFLKFVQDLKTDIVLAPFGTATTQEGLDLVKDDKMVILFPAITESRLFRNPQLKNIVSLSASYYEQGKALINYLLPKYNPQKIALLYQNDDFGKDGLAGAKDALQKFPAIKIVELPYERNQVDFSLQKKIVEAERPDAIGFFSLPLAAVTFMRSLGANFLSQKLLFGISDLRDSDVLQFLKSKGLSFTYANSLPNWQENSMPLVREYELFAQANNISPDPFSFEVYVIAQIFFYLIDRIEGPITKEKIIQAAEKIKNLDFKGLNLNFDPGSRVLLDAVWIAQNNDEPWVRVPINESPQVQVKESQPVELPVKKSEGNVLTLGTSLDLSKSLKKSNVIIKETLTKVFDKKNKTGGIHGLQLRNIFLDDAYTPSIARQNYLKLLNDLNVDLVFGSRGSPTTQEILDLVEAGQLALFFLIGTEAGIFRTATLKNIVNLTVSFYEQAKALINIVFQKTKPQKIAFLYQDDSLGKDMLSGAKSALEQLQFSNIVAIPYKRGQVDFTIQADVIRKENPDVIGLFSTPLPGVELIKTLGAASLSQTLFFGTSTLRDQEFLKFMQEKGLSLLYASTLPDFRDDRLSLAKEYREFASQQGMQPDAFGFEAYIVAHLLLYLIEHIEGPITKEKIILAAENLKMHDFKGLLLNFNPATRVLLNEIWIGNNNNGPWIPVRLDSPSIVLQKKDSDFVEKVSPEKKIAEKAAEKNEKVEENAAVVKAADE